MPWLIVLIVVCLLILLLILLLLWTFCTKTLCFASRDRNNNLKKGSQRQNVGAKNGTANQRPSETIQKLDTKKDQNNDRQYQNKDAGNTPLELKVTNSYDDDTHRFNANRAQDSFTNGVYSGYDAGQDYNNPTQISKQVQT